MKLTGKIVLITGAAKRIGRQIALRFAQEQTNVIIHYNKSRQEALQTAEDVLRAGAQSVEVIKAELTRITQIEKMMSRVSNKFNCLDILINNAAIFFPTPLQETTERQWQQLFDSNLKSVFFCIQKALPLLKKSLMGKIINFSDIMALRPVINHIPYCITKAGVATLTAGLAKELSPDISVNAIGPGPTVFPPEFGKENRERELKKTLLKRFSSPEDIAEACIFLAKSESITGAFIPVDSGLYWGR